jgi:hypothetical protein
MLGDDICPSNVTTARESIVGDGMAMCDMGQMNPIAKQYGVFLDLVFINFPGMFNVAQADDPILRLDQYRPAFVLTCDVQYFRYTSMSKRISRFNFKKADIDAMISHLFVVNRPGVFLINDIETCVGQFYDVIDKCFDLYVPKFVAGAAVQM